MQTLSINDSIEKFLTYGAYHIAMLGTDDDFVNIKNDFVEQQEKLRDINNELSKSRENAQIKMAIRNYIDRMLDREISSLNLQLLDYTGKNRKNPDYTMLFPDGLSGVIRVPLKKEIQKVKFMVSTLLESSLPEELKAYAPKLTTLVNDLNTKIEEYEAVLFEEMKIKLNSKIVKEDWLRVYSGNYGHIMVKHPREKDLVEVFFKRVESGTTPDEEIE